MRELPFFTQIVINISRWLQDSGVLLGIILAAGGYGIKELHFRSEKFRNWLDVQILKIPVIGDILKKAAVARYANTLSTTFAAGVPLIDALESAAGASGNAVFRNAILSIRADVSTGMQMHVSMRSSGIFPDMVTQMVQIGEESGAVDDMLSKIANIYEQQVDDAVDGLSSLIEPMIMAVLGVVIGGLIIAMYLPIFQIGNVVG